MGLGFDMIRSLSESTAGHSGCRLGGLAERCDQERGHAREVLWSAVNTVAALSWLLRVDDDEAVSVRHLDLRQGLSIHLVAWANDSIQIQDVCGNGIYLLIG